jgi:hypothetical protein
LVFDILESRIKKEIDKSIEKLGVRTYDISIDAQEELSIKITLVSDDLEAESLVN